MTTKSQYTKILDEITDYLQQIHPIGKYKGIGRMEAARAMLEVAEVVKWVRHNLFKIDHNPEALDHELPDPDFLVDLDLFIGGINDRDSRDAFASGGDAWEAIWDASAKASREAAEMEKAKQNSKSKPGVASREVIIQTKSNDFVPYPKDWPPYYNGGCKEPCEFLQGPCVCGAHHFLWEWESKVNFGGKTEDSTGLPKIPVWSPGRGPDAQPIWHAFQNSDRQAVCGAMRIPPGPTVQHEYLRMSCEDSSICPDCAREFGVKLRSSSVRWFCKEDTLGLNVWHLYPSGWGAEAACGDKPFANPPKRCQAERPILKGVNDVICSACSHHYAKDFA